jgi:hypothetical protein
MQEAVHVEIQLQVVESLDTTGGGPKAAPEETTHGSMPYLLD